VHFLVDDLTMTRELFALLAIARAAPAFLAREP
jgi:hypothetical protein